MKKRRQRMRCRKRKTSRRRKNRKKRKSKRIQPRLQKIYTLGHIYENFHKTFNEARKIYTNILSYILSGCICKKFELLLNKYICIVPKHVVIQSNQAMSSLEIPKLRILLEIGLNLSFYSCMLSLNNIPWKPTVCQTVC